MNNNFEIFSPTDSAEGPAFTFRDLVSILFKHRRVILVCFSIVTILVSLGMMMLPPTYVAEGKVLVNTEQQGNPSIFSGVAAYREPQTSDPVNRKLETEMEVISTRELSERVVRKLDLQYAQVYHKPLTHLLRPVSDTIDWIKVHIFGYPEDPDAYGFKGTVNAFNNSFIVQPLKSKSAETTSNVIQISLMATDAKSAQTALQSLLEEFVGLTVEQNEKLAREAYGLVEQNLQQAAAELESIREQKRKFIAEKGATLSSRYAGAIPVPLENNKSGDITSNVTNGALTTMGTLRTRLVQSEIRLMELRQIYTDNNENVTLMEGEINTLKKRIEYELKATAENEKTLDTIDLEAKAVEQQYVDLRRKLEQIGLFLKLNPAQAYNRQIAEPPLLPKSSEWKKSLLVTILGSIGGLMLGLGVAGYREYSDHRLNTDEAIEAHLGLKALAVVALLDEAELHAALNPGDTSRSWGGA